MAMYILDNFHHISFLFVKKINKNSPLAPVGPTVPIGSKRLTENDHKKYSWSTSYIMITIECIILKRRLQGWNCVKYVRLPLFNIIHLFLFSSLEPNDLSAAEINSSNGESRSLLWLVQIWLHLTVARNSRSIEPVKRTNNKREGVREGDREKRKEMKRNQMWKRTGGRSTISNVSD